MSKQAKDGTAALEYGREEFEKRLPMEERTVSGTIVYFTKNEYESAWEGLKAATAALKRAIEDGTTEAIKQHGEPVAYLEPYAKYPMCCYKDEIDDEVKEAWIPIYTSAPTIPESIDRDTYLGSPYYADGWNDYREAMLTASPEYNSVVKSTT